MNNCITEFIGLKDINVTNLIDYEDRIEIFIETPPKLSVCPCCGAKSNRIHDYRFQRIKDLPFRGKPLILILRKRRYACRSCGKHFMEKYNFLPRYHHMTQRTYLNILNMLRENCSMKSVANHFNVSSNTVSRVFDIVD